MSRRPLGRMFPSQTVAVRQQKAQPRVFVPSLLPVHRAYIESLVFTDFYEFMHADMIPAGINWLFLKLQLKFPAFALDPSGPQDKVEEIWRVRKEDIRGVVYKALRKAYTYRDGKWMVSTPVAILQVNEKIPVDTYVAAGTHPMRWWYLHSNPNDEWFSRADSLDAIKIQVETLSSTYHEDRVITCGKRRRYYIRAWYLQTLSTRYDPSFLE
ncbi:hypothetical protein V5O48_014923 [Marasmius crinis-equi]|uniref:Uncharacterized protein n=1 Tax=Marasmius crinis-equi TaxID=585013 RepID=A0ABR3EW02_9AGAR